jgi:UDP-glucose:(glucosyl)LPS alpha-1,2-glucosyltransferase
MVNDVNGIFKYNNFGDAKGGTEIMVSGLLEYVDNDILKNFDIIVSYPPKDFIKKDKPVLLWLHDLSVDPYFNILKNEEYQKQFDYFIFVSYWQKEMFRLQYSLPIEKCIVIRNCIEPLATNENKFDNIKKIKLVYSSTPQRGLNILFEVFKELQREYEDLIELNVFSSFDIYGERHKSRNAPYTELYEKLTNSSGIIYHGSVGHYRLLKELENMHIWCLPSIWQETSCISMIEAMSAKCLCVHSDLAALPETSSNFGVMYNYVANINEHAYILYENLRNTLNTIITSTVATKNHLALQKVYFDNFYSWNRRAKEWEVTLNKILK